MKLSTEYVSSEYLHLNSCGIEQLGGKDYERIRSRGRLDYHILYIDRGKCYAEINSEQVMVPEGNLILYTPGEKQKYAFHGEDNSISCFIHFTGTGCAQLIRQIGMENNRILYISRSNTVRSVFEKMQTEYTLRKPFYESLCSAYLMELFAVIARKAEYLENSVYIKNRSAVDRACLLMHEKYSENLPLEYYAKCCNVSVSRFSHIFKASMGIAPLEYIIGIRINHAKDFLLNTGMTISEVAETVGFSNQNYFGRIFKKYTGVSPKKFSEKE